MVVVFLKLGLCRFMCLEGPGRKPSPGRSEVRTCQGAWGRLSHAPALRRGAAGLQLRAGQRLVPVSPDVTVVLEEVELPIA